MQGEIIRPKRGAEESNTAEKMVIPFKNGSYSVTGLEKETVCICMWNFSCFLLKETFEISSLSIIHK